MNEMMTETEKKSDILQVGSNQMELIDFRIFEKRGEDVYEGVYGLNVSKVREIIMLPELTIVPDAPEAIEGIFNLRGVQVPAINLASWLGIEEALPPDTKPKVIVAEFSHYTIGLIVHQASRIRRISWEEIRKAPPLVAHKHGAAIVGTTTLEDGETLLLIDVEKVVAEMQGGSVEDIVEEQLGHYGDIQKHNARILVVDDSAVARKQMTITLQKAGYETMEAENGQEGLDLIKALTQDKEALDVLQLVISDVEMPVMDGYSMTARIKGDEQLRMLPVIMHSSLGGEANLRKGREAGCNEYIVKFKPQTLLEAVARHVIEHFDE